MATSKDNNQRFITSLRDEPKKMLLPIAGYEKAIVKSLDDACEPIEHLFDEYLNTHITIAKTNSTSPEDGLTPDESASIHLYTLEWPVHENSFYMVLNDTLRATDRNKLKPWFKYLKLVLTAFHKLPPSGHTLIWRGVREDLSADYPKDRKFTWWAFSSCTATMKVLESDNYLGKSGSRTIFSIETKSGKSIAAHSYFGNEDEVLLPPGVYFTVVSVLNPADDLHIIQIREIPAPYKSIADPFDLSKKREPLPEPIKPPMKLERSQERIVIPTPPIRREISPIRNSLAKPYVRSVERVENPPNTVSSVKHFNSEQELRIHHLVRE